MDTCDTDGVAHSPDVIGGDGRYPVQVIITYPGIWAENNLPLRAIPVLDERLVNTRDTDGVSNGPDVIGGDDCHII